MEVFSEIKATNSSLTNSTIGPEAENDLRDDYSIGLSLHRQKTNQKELSLKTCSLPGITNLHEYTQIISTSQSAMQSYIMYNYNTHIDTQIHR